MVPEGSTLDGFFQRTQRQNTVIGREVKGEDLNYAKLVRLVRLNDGWTDGDRERQAKL